MSRRATTPRRYEEGTAEGGEEGGGKDGRGKDEVNEKFARVVRDKVLETGELWEERTFRKERVLGSVQGFTVLGRPTAFPKPAARDVVVVDVDVVVVVVVVDGDVGFLLLFVGVRVAVLNEFT